MLTTLFIYLLVGVCTGICAGLFGVGGGTIIVPALILVFVWQGVAPEVLTHIAIGTSLAIIGVTALSAIYAQHKKRAVHWDLVWRLAPAVCVGVWLGAGFASQLSGELLQKAFGVFLLIMALQLFLSLRAERRKAESSPPLLGSVPLSALLSGGSVIGFVSALFGIGGGALTVPFLRAFGVLMQHAAATASAVGFPLAVIGAASYAWQGWQHEQLPSFSSGFIYWPAFAGIALTSVGFAKVGVRLAHSLAPQKLQAIFALFLLAIGVYFLIR